jgi:hypothetical protein
LIFCISSDDIEELLDVILILVVLDLLDGNCDDNDVSDLKNVFEESGVKVNNLLVLQ